MKVVLDGKEIEEGYIIKYIHWDTNVTSIVKFGEWIQDGSGGEYSGAPCYGFYAEVINLEPTYWSDDTKEDIEECYPHYHKTRSVLEILRDNNIENLEIIVS